MANSALHNSFSFHPVPSSFSTHLTLCSVASQISFYILCYTPRTPFAYSSLHSHVLVSTLSFFFYVILDSIYCFFFFTTPHCSHVVILRSLFSSQQTPCCSVHTPPFISPFFCHVLLSTLFSSCSVPVVLSIHFTLHSLSCTSQDLPSTSMPLTTRYPTLPFKVLFPTPPPCCIPRVSPLFSIFFPP